MLHHLTFGRNWSNDRDSQDYVNDLDWEMYCQEVLDSHFDGYTVYDAMGTWKSQPEDTIMLHTLTYGRNIGTQGYVTDLDWELYCQEVLDANFDGYTIQDAMGSWKSVPEDSKVVIINTDNTQLVTDCAQLYKEMYQQEAVGLFTTATPMEFI